MGPPLTQYSDAKDNILFGARYDEARYKKGEIFLSSYLPTAISDTPKSFINVHWSAICSSSRPVMVPKLVKRDLHSGMVFLT